MKVILFVICALFSATQLVSQDNVGIGTSTPHASAALEVTSNNKGVLFPRMSSAQRTAISGVEGLLVFDTDSSSFYFHDGAIWVKLASGLTDAENGLTIDAVSKRLKIGGELLEPTTIKHGNYTFHHNLDGSGDFKIQDNGVFKFGVIDNGRVTIGANANVGAFNVTGQSFYSDKLTLRDGAVGAADLIKINREGGAGVLETLKSGVVKNRIHADSSSYVTGGNFGIGTSTPNPRATLELNDAEDGFLPTRSTRALMDAIPLTAAEAGMLYFDTNTKKYNQWDGTQWNELRTGSDLWQENTTDNSAYYTAGNVNVGSSSAFDAATKLTIRANGSTGSTLDHAGLKIDNDFSSPAKNVGLKVEMNNGATGTEVNGIDVQISTSTQPTPTNGQKINLSTKSELAKESTGQDINVFDTGTGFVKGSYVDVRGGTGATMGTDVKVSKSGTTNTILIGSNLFVQGNLAPTSLFGSRINVKGNKGANNSVQYGESITVGTSFPAWEGQLMGSHISIVPFSPSNDGQVTGQYIDVKGHLGGKDPAYVEGVSVRATAARDTTQLTRGGHFVAYKNGAILNNGPLTAVAGEVSKFNSSGPSHSFLGSNNGGGEDDYAFYASSGHSYFKDDVRLGVTGDVPGYKLAVRGGIIADSLRLLPYGSWPDYVFDEDYNLLSLEEVKAHIQSKKHLPGIPSAAEIENNKGIELFEMNKILLEKIEELTLHAIQLNEENKSVQHDNSELHKRLNSLEGELSEIKNMLKK